LDGPDSGKTRIAFEAVDAVSVAGFVGVVGNVVNAGAAVADEVVSDVVDVGVNVHDKVAVVDNVSDVVDVIDSVFDVVALVDNVVVIDVTDAILAWPEAPPCLNLGKRLVLRWC